MAVTAILNLAGNQDDVQKGQGCLQPRDLFTQYLTFTDVFIFCRNLYV
jgi:hypothetical protein